MKKYIPRLKEKYINEVVPKLKDQLGYSNIMQVPSLEKICLNQGVGQAVNDKKLIEIRKKFKSAFIFRPELTEIIDDLDEINDEEQSNLN